MPLITNGKRDYKREYAAILLRRKNNKEYDAKYKDTKYKNLSLSKDTYTKIDRLRRVIVPNTVVSWSQTVNILANEKVEKLNGKGKEK